jgi:predicted dehydrogenase
MIVHAATRLLWVAAAVDPAQGPLFRLLKGMPHIDLQRQSALPANLDSVDVVLTAGPALSAKEEARLAGWIGAGGGWLHLVKDCSPLPQVLGVTAEPLLPESELRVLFRDPVGPLAQRLPPAIYVHGCRAALRLQRDEAHTWLYADWHFDHRPVLSVCGRGRGQAACTTLTDFDHPVLRRIFYRVLRQLGGISPPQREVGVGILGYAPWIGRIHGTGVEQTPGLTLTAIGDIASPRRHQASIDFPSIAVHATAESLIQDPAVDLVIVATPPNTHAELSLKLLAAGKHVVCEKPLALNRAETDHLVSAAAQAQRLLCCHQNRRWDPDYLALKEAVATGTIGELYYLETFVGGFQHPCGYWHSHAPVSGGAAYDWGAHYLDWIVSLIPQPVRAVSGTRHKRVWHDVTNADQERIQVRFDGGQEAEFLHSDIAAARKPKWYALGTKAAIAGAWRDLNALRADPLLYFQQESIPATEMPPEMILHEPQRDGQITSRALALPARDPFGFHRNLADHVLTGEPLTAPLADSIKVVAILEAAARSMRKGGTLEVLDD